VVAHKLLKDMGVLKGADAIDDGYGGKLLPSFPSWLIDGTRPSKLAWLLKEQMLPPLYWRAMLKGREWMATPELVG
jgi:sulfide:quinone oxidoreductase